MEDTIVAIATTVGFSALNVIRISGQNSIEIVNKICSKDLTKLKANTINYTFIIENDEKIDEVLVSIFKSPKSFTTEDVVEINTHGGTSTVNKIMQLLIKNGCRQAEPGEFIKRAFLNGRIDLIEAEAVSDLINSKTEEARKISMKGIEGKISNKIRTLREEILSLIANIEVNIDYPEYEDALVITNNLLKDKIENIKKQFENILENSKNNKIIINGISAGIIGSPNVGKSSLLNALLEEEKAIVTDIEGTTRDTVEGSIIISGIEVKLIDTAGIRKTKDKVEEIGVKKSYQILKNSDIILFVLDNNRKITKEEESLIKTLDKEKTIIIINKLDLKSNIDKNKLKDFTIVEISLKNENNLETLKNKIKELFNIEKIKNRDYTYLCNARQIGLIEKALIIIKEIEEELNLNVEIDLIEINIRRLWDILGEILGESYNDELLDEIFSKFCLGK
ncbi:MAG: tRNA uridine-5-carboxymethylaminomethyl(34) synthesis GTPase MnmE [Bacilli bacterium]|nr:tRNA uridine-5-carboxymethylaminomethyl(34) synthesis GTPase MnmE [Bacilli bacterium]